MPKYPQAYEHFDPEAEALVDEARTLFERKDYEGAKERFLQVLASNKIGNMRHGSTLIELGDTEYSLGNVDTAMALMYESMKVFPGCVYSYQRLTLMYMEQKRPLGRLRVIAIWLKNFPAIMQDQRRRQDDEED